MGSSEVLDLRERLRILGDHADGQLLLATLHLGSLLLRRADGGHSEAPLALQVGEVLSERGHPSLGGFAGPGH